MESINDDHGVLNCQGLNRSLLLPKFFKDNYSNIDRVYAPIPHFADKFSDYSMRPLQTAMPTATYFNSGVDVSLDAEESQKLVENVTKISNEDKTVVVVWNHKKINPIAEGINDLYNGLYEFDEWEDEGFDSIYEINIKKDVMTYHKKSENLTDKLDRFCPNT